jgi:hypothetical protein
MTADPSLAALDPFALSNEAIASLYAQIEAEWAAHLAARGVKLPSQHSKSGQLSQGALVLVRLAVGYPQTRPVSKTDLTGFIRRFYPQTNDVQEARHLAAQGGFFIASGTRGDVLPDGSRLPASAYQLVTLSQPYPGFDSARRIETGDFEEIKEQYHHRCATCGSQEGQPHLQWPQAITQLQPGHMNPRLALGPKNTIPQCAQCNRADRNYFRYDDRGRVVAVAALHPVEIADKEVQLEIYHYLKAKFQDEVVG